MVARRNLCVFCSSSGAAAPEFFAAAREAGRTLVQRGYDLIFGGANVGLMGAVADAVRDSGGRITGVIPAVIREKGIAYLDAHELIDATTMKHRKQEMEDRADAFLILPGGIGTLDEFFEVLVHKQLRLHTKPIVALNTNGFFDPLAALLERVIEQSLAHAVTRDLYAICDTVEEAFTALETAPALPEESKWIGPRG